MSFGTVSAGDLLALAFTSVALPAAWTSTLKLALHTSDPGVGNAQSSNEVSYTGYSRLTTTRDFHFWTASPALGQVVNAIQYAFGAMTGGAGGTVTHISAALSNGQIVACGPIVPIPLALAVAPTFPAGVIAFVNRAV